MTLDARALGLVALVVGSPAAVGCAAGDTSPDLPAPEETVATAPEEPASPPGAAADAHPVHYYGPHPPPAPREERGAPPSPQHFWAPGFYRWNGRDHVWTPGSWIPRRDGLDYVAPHWENVYSRYEYIPGRWFRR